MHPNLLPAIATALAAVVTLGQPKSAHGFGLVTGEWGTQKMLDFLTNQTMSGQGRGFKSKGAIFFGSPKSISGSGHQALLTE